MQGERLFAGRLAPRRGGERCAHLREAARGLDARPYGGQAAERERRRRAGPSDDPRDVVLDVHELIPGGERAHQYGAIRRQPASQDAQVPQHGRRDGALRGRELLRGAEVTAVGAGQQQAMSGREGGLRGHSASGHLAQTAL